MSQCTPRYLPLCSIPPVVSRDGYAGASASIYLPFFGRYFFSGAQYTFPNSSVPQSAARTVGGLSIPGAFSKEGGICS